MPFGLGLMDPRQVTSSQLRGHLHLYDTPHAAISPADRGLVVPGKQAIPIWLTIIIGIIASFIGGYIALAFGYRNANGGIPWIVIILQVIVAAIGVSIAAGPTPGEGSADRCWC